MSIFPTKILLATDGSDDAELATTTAVDLSSKRLDSELHVVYVEPMPERHGTRLMRFAVDLPVEVVESAEKEAQTKLEEQVQEIKQAGGQVAQAHPKEGLPAAEIVALAEDLGVGLIVMGSSGLGGIRRALMGSVSDSVVRHAHCPVLVVRGEPISFPIKILLATDGSKDVELAATTAADLARSTGSELHVVSVFPYVHSYYEDRFPEAAERLRREAREEPQEMLDEQVERIREAGGSVAQTHIRAGEPAAEIVTLAEELEADLIAMGSRGLGGVGRALMGSVSDAVVRHAHCPVMVVRE